MVNIHEAKTHLSRILERVRLEEEIILAKSGQPVAHRDPFDRLLAAQSEIDNLPLM